MKTQILMAVAIVAMSMSAQATTIEDSIADFTRDISKYMRFHRETQVFVEPIVGPDRIGTATPSSIRALLQDRLRHNRLSVSESARLRILCRCNHTFDSAGRPIGITIQGLVVDAYDDVLTEFTLTAVTPAGSFKTVSTKANASFARKQVAKKPAPIAVAKPKVVPPRSIVTSISAEKPVVKARIETEATVVWNATETPKLHDSSSQSR